MENNTGQEIIAIESFDEETGILKIYGKGEFTGARIPDCEPFKSHGTKNPCLRLFDGRILWGFQCWWSEMKSFSSMYCDKIKGIEYVEPEEYFDELQEVTEFSIS